MEKFLTQEDQDAFTFGIFDGYGDVVLVNGKRQNVEAMHGTALWRALLAAIQASDRVVLHPSVSTREQLMEILITFRAKHQGDCSVYQVEVGNHGLCTAL